MEMVGRFENISKQATRIFRNRGFSGMIQRRPTIVEIARKAGVSTGTVSHVMNQTARVRPPTRKKVDDAILAISYLSRPYDPVDGRISRRDPDHAGSLTCPRLVSVGYISVDYTARVEVMPHREDRISARHIGKALGGPAANVAVCAAALGGDFQIDVDLATALGSDVDSQWALEELARKNVRALPIRTPSNGHLSRCFIIVEANGCRTIINEPFELSEADLPVQLASDPCGRPRCLHMEGYHVDGMQGTLLDYRKHGWKLSLQTTGLPSAYHTRNSFGVLLTLFDIIFVNAELGREITKCRPSFSAIREAFCEMLKTITDRGIVILTLGESGAVVFDVGDDAGVHIAAMAVDVVDATGAGDAFCGSFLGVWLKSSNLYLAAQYGAVAGGLAVTAEGAQGHIANAAEIQDVLAQLAWLPLVQGATERALRTGT